MKITLFTFVLLVLLVQTLSAQNPQWKIYNTGNSGLPFNAIRSLAIEYIPETNLNIAWMGNAGGQTKIENCTFNDAKKPIEIINTSNCSANLDKKIISNEFNLPATRTKCIYAENVFKLLLHGNTFNIAPGKTGVEISNSINAESSEERCIFLPHRSRFVC